ncbi:MAG TPA: FtsQ-type POTRA domain-containing protein [Candidatus Omnitrophota bacterium]|nr:FtsQ-type POTRA domain-containing protein [Candidatus Omnitrophota bacterium]
MGRKKNKKRGKKNGFWASVSMFIIQITKHVIPLMLIVAAFLFGAVGVWKVLLADTHLRISEIRVVPSDVLTSAHIKVLEDKLIGKNIMGLDLRKVESEIELGPGAKGVRVVRELPSTIRIEIEKRKPAANMLFKARGAYGIVADDGIIIATSNVMEPAWVLIENFSEPIQEPKIGAKIQNKGFPEALKFLKKYEKHDLSRKERITRVMLDPYGNVTIRLGEGPDFQLGRRPTEKFPMLSKAMYLFKTEAREGVDYMDLQFDRIAVKRKQS